MLKGIVTSPPPSGGSSPITFVRQDTGSATFFSTTPTTVVTMGATPATNQVLVASLLCWHNGGTTIGTINLTQTNVTWNRVTGANRGNGTAQVELWWGVPAASAGTAVKMTNSDFCNEAEMNVSSWTGLLQSGVVDGTAATNSGTITTETTSAYSNTQAKGLVFTNMGVNFVANPSSTPSGYTVLTAANAAASYQINSAYKIVAATGAQSATWTTSGAGDWDTILVSFKGN